MTQEVIVLGSGSSTGVPIIGGDWGACDPDEPKNRRTRASIAICYNKTIVVVDTGTDFRNQLNREEIMDITAVLYTHAHGDHINGIDDLRPISVRGKKEIPIHANKDVLNDLLARYFHLFRDKHDLYPKVLGPNLVVYGKPINIEGLDIIPFEQDHGSCVSTGYRFGNIGYSTDMVDLPERSIEILKGIDTWLVDATGYKFEYSPVHATLKKVYELNEQIGAKKIYITHLPAHMDYQTLCNELPENYKPAYDGLRIPFHFS